MKLDSQTLELPGLPDVAKPRGRPKTGNALSAAQRMRKMRQARADDLKSAKKLERRRSDAELVAALAVRLELDDIEGAKLAWLELGRRKSWKLG